MMAALQAALDASAKVKDRSMHTVDVDEPVIRDSIVVPDTGRVVHDRDCVKILGERCTRRWFGPLTVAGPASEMYGTDGRHPLHHTHQVEAIHMPRPSNKGQCRLGSVGVRHGVHTPDERESSHDKPAPRTTPIGA